MDIQKLREETNLTLWEVASALGVTKQAVNDWELGKKRIPPTRIPELEKIFADPDKYRQYTLVISYDQLQELLKKMPELKDCVLSV